MIIDQQLRKKQVWVEAQQKQSDRVSSVVYFPALPEEDLDWLEEGDAPSAWNGENPSPPENKSHVKAAGDRNQACSYRQRLELSREDLLQRQIEKAERDIAQLQREIDNPEEEEQKKKDKEESRKKATNQKKWYEFSPALGGSWLKASTGPPKYDSPLHILLIRDGKVIDVVKTNISRYCQWTTPEYRLPGRGPGWGIQKPSMSFTSSNGLFPNAQIGDCSMVQIKPPDLDDTKFSDFCKMPQVSIHQGLIDLDVVKYQTKIAAMQKTSERTFNSVYFDPLDESKTEVKAGDQLWPTNPAPDASMWKEQDERFRQQDRQKVLGTKEDQQKQRMEVLVKALQDLKDIRDIPRRREELWDEFRAKNPVCWYESSVALNGAWIKASTWPPSGNLPVDMLRLRNGQVKEVISTTLEKISKFGPYKGGEYSTTVSTGPHPGWGVGADMLTISNVFSEALEIGDCVMLKVPLLECEEGKLIG